MAESDDDRVASVLTFLGTAFRAGLGLFPLLFSINTVALSPGLSAWQVAAGSLALALPVAVEFTASGRSIDALEQFVVGVLLLWLVAVAARAGAGLLGASPDTADLVGLVLVGEGYVLSYLLVYAGWGVRLRENLGD